MFVVFCTVGEIVRVQIGIPGSELGWSWVGAMSETWLSGMGQSLGWKWVEVQLEAWPGKWMEDLGNKIWGDWDCSLSDLRGSTVPWVDILETPYFRRLG